ncbi:MAG TPA: 50S ribosomal protein L11 methyltransferase [Chitinophagaceae bacterium]|nr:50S ribosomal protein L11 methyltransferase [Chitinophagaceae bacterium]
MGRYIQIEFQDITQEQSDILIAQLNEAGFEGFEEAQGKLRAYISESGYEETVVNELTRSSGIKFSKIIIEETNWNQLWESNFDPVVVDDYAAVRADFREPIPNVTHEIIITPKMSFGTGHHATTNLMIRQMKELDLNGKIVFDKSFEQ